MSTAVLSLIVSCIATLIALGSFLNSWQIKIDSKKKEKSVRENQPLNITVHQKTETHSGLQSDMESVQFDDVIFGLTRSFIDETSIDLGTLVAKRPDICFIDEPFLYVNVDITGVDDYFFLNLQVPIFEFTIENGSTKIRKPEWRRDRLTFQTKCWEEVRSRIERYVKGKKYDFQPITMKFSSNIIYSKSTLKDKKLKLIIENSI